MFKEDAEYVLQRIESMLRLLESRADSESAQAIVELTRFRSSVQNALTDECRPTEYDFETEFYELVGNQRTLGLAFLDAMEMDVNNIKEESQVQ